MIIFERKNEEKLIEIEVVSQQVGEEYCMNFLCWMTKKTLDSQEKMGLVW